MASSQGIRAGRAFVELFLDDHLFLNALSFGARKLQQFAQHVQVAGAAAGVGAAALTAPLTAAFVEAASRGRDVDLLAQRFGLTTESVSTLAAGLEQLRIPFGEFDSIMTGLSGKIKAAADSNTELVSGLAGLNGRWLLTQPLDKAFEILAERIKGITLASDRAAVAQELFGQAGLRMLPVLNQGAEGVRKMKEQMAAAGFGVSAEEARQSTAVMNAANMVWAELGLTIRDVGAALLPTTDATGDYTAKIREAFGEARTWISEHKEMIVIVAKVAAGLTGISVVLLILAPALKATAFAFRMLHIAVAIAGTSILGFTYSITGFLVGGLVWLVKWLLTTTTAGTEMCERVAAGFREFAETAKEAWGGIVAAIGKGDLNLAFEIAGAGLRLEWLKIVNYWTGKWESFKNWWLSTIEEIRMGLAGLIAEAGEFIGVLPEGTARAVVEDSHAIEADRKRARDAEEKAMADKIAEAVKNFRDLVAKAKEPGPAGAGGDIAKAVAADPAMDALNRIKEHQNRLPQLFGSTKGLFAGPSQQMLGYGDQVPKRQLDALQKIDQNTENAAKTLIGLAQSFMFG